jgi:hypothetical protein
VIDEIKSLLEEYSKWLHDKNVLREVDDKLVEITTPYLDRHNDYMQIYVKKNNGGYFITDGGDTLKDLRLSGCDIETQKRKDLLTSTLNGFGVQKDGEILFVKASANDFSLRKHNLLQAVLAVNDLFYLAVPIVASIFLEDVMAWLQLHDIRFTPNVKFTGKSGYDHNFDFVIPSSRKAPERLLRAISKPTRDIAESLAFAWIDIKEVRPTNSHFYAILNDEGQIPAATIVDALVSYEILPVMWSKREEVRIEFEG